MGLEGKAETENPKYEALNTKQAQITKIQISKRLSPEFGALAIRILNLFRA